MRITILHSRFTAIGGAEQLIASQTRWLTAAGHTVRLVALQVDRKWSACNLPDIPIAEIGLPLGVHKMEQLTAPMLADIGARAGVHLRGADVVMAFNFPSAPIAALASEAPCVWYACEPFRSLYLEEANPFAVANAIQQESSLHNGATRQIERRLLRRRLAHALLPWSAQRANALRSADTRAVNSMHSVASPSEYGALCTTGATGRAEVSVLSPMVELFSDRPHRRGLNRDAPEILVQARLGVPKNLDTLIEGFAAFRRGAPRAMLHVVGSGAQRAPLERLAARVAPGAVQFHGFLQQQALDELATRCDAFAFAPVDEPFGMVFPEAASRGLLLIGPDHGGPREILEHGAIGELCDPFRAESISDALSRTFAFSDAEADQRRDTALDSMRSRFAAAAVGPQLEAFLGGVTPSPTAALIEPAMIC